MLIQGLIVPIGRAALSGLIVSRAPEKVPSEKVESVHIRKTEPMLT